MKKNNSTQGTKTKPTHMPCPAPLYHHGAHPITCQGPRHYEALKNDANDKRPLGTWKVAMTWTDERGYHAQKFAQEIYRKDHARQIADAMNAAAIAKAEGVR